MDILQGLQLMNVTELTIIILVCYLLTAAAKKSKLDNKYMTFISMIAGLLVGGWTSDMFDGIQGFLNNGGTSE